MTLGIAFSSILPWTCQASCKTDGGGSAVPRESFWSLVQTFIAKLPNHLVSRQNAIATDEEECEQPYIISVCWAEAVQRALRSHKQLACAWCSKGARREGGSKLSVFFPVLVLHIDIGKRLFDITWSSINLLATEFHGRLFPKIKVCCTTVSHCLWCSLVTKLQVGCLGDHHNVNSHLKSLCWSSFWIHLSSFIVPCATTLKIRFGFVIETLRLYFSAF